MPLLNTGLKGSPSHHGNFSMRQCDVLGSESPTDSCTSACSLLHPALTQAPVTHSEDDEA